MGKIQGQKKSLKDNLQEYIALSDKQYEIIEKQRVEIEKISGELESLQVKKKDLQKQCYSLRKENSELKEQLENQTRDTDEVDFRDVVVEEGTMDGIPLGSSHYKRTLIHEARSFIENVNYQTFVDSIAQRVIGQPNLELLLAGVYNYICGIAKSGVPAKVNTLLTAPSGSGKTETYRALKDYLSVTVPSLVIDIIDFSHITTEGFKGKDSIHVVMSLFEKETEGFGILFLDEFDKRISPQYTYGGENVGEGVQNQLLTLIEGRVEKFQKRTIDTSLTMFIGCGSFNSVRERKRQVASKRSIGFINQTTDYDIFDDITREDIIASGCTCEMLGRFAVVVNYCRLNEEAIKRIIDKTVESIAVSLGMEIKLGDDFTRIVVGMANGELGCRMIHSIIYEKALKAYVDALKTSVQTPTVTIYASGYKFGDVEKEQVV